MITALNLHSHYADALHVYVRGVNDDDGDAHLKMLKL